MIHTVTFNPGIDISLEFDRLRPGEVQRPSKVSQDAGGKGMNVAVALRKLGLDATAWTFLGGCVGNGWLQLAKKTGVNLQVIEIQSETRQNVKIFERATRRQTDINLPGAAIEESELNGFLESLESRLEEHEIVVVAGSVPEAPPKGYWERFGSLVSGLSGRLVVDTSGPALKELAKQGPWLLKVNRAEFNALTGKTAETLSEVVHALQEKRDLRGNVIVTDGPEGAVASSAEGTRYRINAPGATVRGTVGAGDAFTAGWLAGWIESAENWEFAMRFGAATAAASVELPGTSFPGRGQVETMLGKTPEPEKIGVSSSIMNR